MKQILCMIIGMSIISVFVLPPQSFASCIENEDWSDAPCMDSFPISRAEFQNDWAPYYDYKGSEFMESKYVEMKQAIDNGIFNEWKSSLENSNVYYYYLSVGQIENQFDRFVFDDEIGKYATFPFYFVITVVSIFAIVGFVVSFVIWRKRK